MKIFLIILFLSVFTVNLYAENTLKTDTGFYYPANKKHSGSYLAFGSKNSRFGNKCHLANDYKVGINTPIYSVADGVVEKASLSVGSYGGDTPSVRGGAMIIKHKTLSGSVFYALYGHLKNLKYAKGDSVKAGRHIGDVRDYVSAGSSIPHLHFGINSNIPSYAGYTPTKNCNNYLGYIDPEPFLKNNYPANSTVSNSKSSYFDGAGSLIKPDGNCYGCQHDAADMQKHNIPSTVVFQWKSTDNCKHLKVGVQGEDSNGRWIAGDESLDVLIHTKAWDKHKSTAYKATLPLTVDSEHTWNTTAITSQNQLSSMTRIIAECTDSYIRTDREAISADLVDLSGGYFWSGNGSIITRALDDKTTGKTQDWAVTFDSNKAITAFQWDASESCISLNLEAGWRGEDGEVPIIQVDMKGWATKSWPDDNHCKRGKLPCTIDAPSSGYYIVKIKTKGGVIPSRVIHASCN